MLGLRRNYTGTVKGYKEINIGVVEAFYGDLVGIQYGSKRVEGHHTHNGKPSGKANGNEFEIPVKTPREVSAHHKSFAGETVEGSRTSIHVRRI